MTRPARILLVAAESSGDRLGADLIRALRATCGDRELEFHGTGGSAMAAEGFTSTFDIADLSVLGLFEAVSAYPRVVKRADDVADLAEKVRPDVAVLIDSWGFTLRVAQRLHVERALLGVPVEGARVDVDHGLLVLAGDERAQPDAFRKAWFGPFLFGRERAHHQ